MADVVPATYGSRFYNELRRLSGFDFVELSYEDIQRLKAADQELAIKLAIADASWTPKAESSPEEFAAEFVERAALKADKRKAMISGIFDVLWVLTNAHSLS